MVVSAVVPYDEPAGADPGFGQGGSPASEAESCWCSKAKLHEQSKLSVAGSRALKQTLEAVGFLMLKYAFSYILDSFSLIFDIYFNTKRW